ncbi:(Fe-S)-binding protein [Paenibacillus lignilyticus]|uniref:(Fe-S)-binding protein n=1 Tax=Paenibacillus lignilyticus TaxID=1172615 RepID=A0ABS5CL42_9BACL|nr:(Fe-S)-binding protein [Paenibacillus lignilyticus]MBP3966583.1 (Fe-S)-binding protein [Paenibacillus lignilyticus]
MANSLVSLLESKEGGKCSELATTLKSTLDYDQLTNCMRCGFCLPACPTFRETGIEAESPRGRIALMKAVADGIMDPDYAFETQMNHCLGCRACEPACPADVKYGQLLEQARDSIEQHTTSHRWWVKLARKTAFEGMFPHQKRMRLLGGALQIYQQSGLRKLVRGVGLMKLFPAHMGQMERILPEASYRGVVEQIGSRHPAKGERVGTVGLFRGCIMDVLFTETNKHTVELLNEAGFDVVIPETQNCCGALHAHSGEQAGAKELAKRNIKAFQSAGVDWIASNAGGCGALLVEYDHLLHDDPQWAEGAAWFAKRTLDVSKLLVEHGRLQAAATQAMATSKAAAAPSCGSGGAKPGCGSGGAKPGPVSEAAAETAAADGCGGSCGGGGVSFASADKVRITYQDSCHLRNAMRSSEAPRKLMRSVANAEFIELREADRCCGSAGIYNLTQPDMAGQILDHKMEHVQRTDAHYLLTSNPGCLLQMKLGIEKHGMGGKMEAVHLVDFLHERICK